MNQCSSCGGVCKKSGCERENLPRYTVGPYKVDYADFQKALELACYYQNRCCDLEEIVEMFCMDAERYRWAVQLTDAQIDEIWDAHQDAPQSSFRYRVTRAILAARPGGEHD
jgi:hypothetical protein